MHRCPVCDEKVKLVCPQGHTHDLSGNRLPDSCGCKPGCLCTDCPRCLLKRVA